MPRLLPQSAPRHDAERQNSHSNQHLNPLCFSTVRFGNKNRPQRCRTNDPRDADALRAGFSLILLLGQIPGSQNLQRIKCIPPSNASLAQRYDRRV